MSTLIVIDQPPYGTWAGREALDMAFSLAAFDQSVSLLFTGAGVNWLRKSQKTDGIEQKSIEKNLSAAPIFGVKAMFAEASACARYGLTIENMLAGVAIAENSSNLLHQYSHTAFSG
ncbi:MULTISPECIES: DsrE family protein [unclassified Marinobacter]|uniref:DsrE family protein n=1 Tax=unclassified Marinobacter TaxID=83889 RepID=UPI0026E2E327|nr:MULTISPECIES: DsrE family protein [unclassified Marinobacter]MDO6442411.1 DsrE family protein [Marinobacter sp. 2_MG-2023]MDO6824467.1 DsrE family protein [Marinobacter sp. 1_MG-2023]